MGGVIGGFKQRKVRKADNDMKMKLLKSCLITQKNSGALCALTLGAAITFGSAPGVQAQSQATSGAASGTNGPSHAERALGLLKPVADKLSSTKTMRFKTESMVEVPAPPGQVINYFFSTEVEVVRPNKLLAKKRGDGPAFDVYYNGHQFSGVDEKLGLYAEMDAPPTLDELIPAVLERTGLYFPFADLLYMDVYGTWTKGLTHAYWVDKSTVAGVPCEHLAFAGPGVEWQIWVGPEEDPLPRRLAVTYVGMERQPRFLVTFSDWDLKSELAADHFEFKKPTGLKAIEFRPLKEKGQ
jgi:hypothetical protein